MTNIIKFPNGGNAPAQPIKNNTSAAPAMDAKGKVFTDGAIRVIWTLTVLIWPVLRWVIAIEVFFQFIRMAWLWNTPSTYAGWTFLLHFAIFTALIYFVSTKPKGI